MAKPRGPSELALKKIPGGYEFVHPVGDVRADELHDTLRALKFTTVNIGRVSGSREGSVTGRFEHPIVGQTQLLHFEPHEKGARFTITGAKPYRVPDPSAAPHPPDLHRRPRS